MTSSLRDANPKGDIFGRTIQPRSLTVIAFILAKLRRWAGNRPPPGRPQKTKTTNKARSR